MDFFSGENLINLIKAVGYIGLFVIVFAESGLLVGLFLPGDSLLFTAGFLASQGFLNIYVLIALTMFAAIAGDSVGYAFGYKIGNRFFKKKDSLFFHQENVTKAKLFYEKHGSKTIVLARFVPFVRTFAPIIAGIGKMEYRKFLFYNVIGGVIWTVLLTTLGYFLGKVIPDIDKYLLPIVLAIIVLSLSPSVFHLLMSRRRP